MKIADEEFKYLESEDCLVLDKSDVYSKLMGTHSLHENFLLQKPLQITLHDETDENPK